MSGEPHAKIWLVCTGEYSDYGVVALFDDAHKADAEEFAKLVGGYVEEHPLSLNPTHQDPPAGQSFFYLEMCRDGSLGSWLGSDKGIKKKETLQDDGTLRESSYRLWTHAECPLERRSHWRLNVWMYARDEKHAIKVANEIRIQILAGAKPSEGSIP